MNPREIIVILSLYFLAVFLYIYQIALQNELIEQDHYFALLETTLAKTRQENLILEDEILQKESLSYIDFKARRMGFIPITDKNILYIR